ncbi:hypothetical protein RRG08_058151 [Elysia crispata]|uniref:Amine oxidase n=1 Tax=Elysia crispata TaxID=231223 RepID=A0AAE0Y278_9GAST|nr:hypothetical protein RRG08_058151 [Elysia crispata]
MTSFVQQSGRVWQIATGILLVVSIGLLIALIVVASEDKTKTRVVTLTSDSEALTECGQSNPNGNTIDLSEPADPGPFHDLTEEEMRKLRTYLQNDPDIQANKVSQMSTLRFQSSYIYMADLWVPPKSEVLNFLDSGGLQPQRQAHVMMFRGDKSPPVVEEWICGPLPDVAKCDLMNFPNRRNPVEFESRPFSLYEFFFFHRLVSLEENKIRTVLMESYNATFSECDTCLVLNPVPTASGLTGELHERHIWVWALYDVPFQLLHPTDFGLQLNLTGSDSNNWNIIRVWYHGQVFDSLEDLAQGYANGTIQKSKLKKPVYSDDLFSTLHRRGDYSPPKPQRPPTIVEPDGKRYSIKDKKVDYLDWTFNFRHSPFTGPQLYDIRFKGERIVYEFTVSEIAAFYSGDDPLTQVTDYVDSGALSGMGSKALVPGGDCPDSSTLIGSTVWNQHGDEPGRYDAVFCMFEINNGYPLRRHLSYGKPSGYYGGMLDSVLTLRSILTVGNYDYVIDFIFHQNGALETKLMSTGFIQGNVFRVVERKYGFRLEETLTGNLHHHMFNLKVDLDVAGTSNRYETLNVEPMDTKICWDKTKGYAQTKFTTDLKQTEQEALYKFNFDHPKYHIVHNNDKRNKWGEKKAFRIHLSGMSKNLMPENLYNEKVISWARQQIAVTKRKEEEFRSSSNYGMYDSLDPVVDFSTFYADNETIVDEDLVFWLTLGLHHIPHTEDLPVTATPGNHLTAMILPYNYFLECPSMGSRDAIFVSYKDNSDISKGLKVERNGNSRDQCILPKPSLEDDIEDNPDQVLETKRELLTL